MKNHYKTIFIAIDEKILTITLNRPEKRNALNDILLDELSDAFKKAESIENIRAIILTGNGTSFCSGADLNYLQDMQNYNDAENLSDSTKLMELFFSIYKHPKPVIAVVNGPAIAGGAGLAIVCDFVLADVDAKFGFPEIKIGFIPAIVSAFLIQQIGERKARELLLTGAIISAKDAKKYGIINKLYKSEKAQNSILQKYLGHIYESSPVSIRETKKMICNHFEGIFYRQLSINAKRNAEFRREDDFKEGISTFLNKRMPYWKIK